MIRRKKDFNDKPSGLTGKKCKALIGDVMADCANHQHNSYYYGHKSVRKKLKDIYGRKCAYCESRPTASSSIRVDHYRPKDNIEGVGGHDGYYWLTYEWSNLIQSCEKCNGVKSNHFPLSDEATRTPCPCPDINGYPNPDWCDHTKRPLKAEKRLLLNPEIDKVEGHFIFHPDGTVTSRTKKGKESIRKYGLDRPDLVFERKEKSEKYLKKINKQLEKFEKAGATARARQRLLDRLEIIIEDIFEEGNEEIPHSAYGFFMFDDFERFYVLRAKGEQALLREAYRDFKRDNL